MSQRTTRSAAQKAMDAMDASKGGVEDVSKIAKEDVSKAQSSLSNDTSHFSLIRAMHLADLITEMNGFCGVMSVFSSMRYMALGDKTATGNIYAALAFIPLGFFFDAMDGAVARSRRTSSLMGQELDSLADLISFGLSPACAAFALGFSTPLDHLILIFFVLCGLTRLARFNVSVDNVPRDANGKSKYFEGTPIPTTMAIAGMMAYWVSKGWVGADLPLGTMGSGWCEVHPVLAVFVLWGVGMTSKTIHVPKPSIPGL